MSFSPSQSARTSSTFDCAYLRICSSLPLCIHHSVSLQISPTSYSNFSSTSYSTSSAKLIFLLFILFLSLSVFIVWQEPNANSARSCDYATTCISRFVGCFVELFPDVAKIDEKELKRKLYRGQRRDGPGRPDG